ncbi:hypothetical protein V8F06_002520 [Rhypophila decipiens]
MNPLSLVTILALTAGFEVHARVVNPRAANPQRIHQLEQRQGSPTTSAPPEPSITGSGDDSNFINFLDKRQGSPTTLAPQPSTTVGGDDSNFINFLD